MMERMDEITKTDERFDPDKNPMPFDGARMIYGGFEAIVEHGEPTSGAYVQGFVIPVPAAKKEAYRKMAEEAWDMFRGYGALRVVEAWQDEVPEGKQTDFFRSVKTQPGEKVVFSFMEWPSREICDAAASWVMVAICPSGTNPPADVRTGMSAIPSSDCAEASARRTASGNRR